MIIEIAYQIKNNMNFAEKIIIEQKQTPKYINHVKCMYNAILMDEAYAVKLFTSYMGYKTHKILDIAYEIGKLKYIIFGIIIMKIGNPIFVKTEARAIGACKMLLTQIIESIIQYSGFYLNCDIFRGEDGKIFQSLLNVILKKPNKNYTKLLFCEKLNSVLDLCPYQHNENTKLIKVWCNEIPSEDFFKKMKMKH